MSTKKKLLGVVASITPGFLGGCAFTSLLPTVAVAVALTGAFLQIAVTAGTPSQTAGQISFSPSDGITVGRGSIELDPSVISLSAVSGGSKVSTVSQQVVDACLTACNAASVDSATCDTVCNSGACEVTVWVAAPDDEATVCTGGTRDEYGPYLVTLDDNGQGVSVDPPSVTLEPLTIQLLNAGSLSACIQVVAPTDGTVAIAGLTINVGL